MSLQLVRDTGVDGFSFVLGAMLTYLAHAAVWAAVIGTLTRTKALSAACNHSLWRAALFGPFVSASGAMLCTRGLVLRVVSSSRTALATPLATPLDGAAAAQLATWRVDRVLVCMGLLAVALGALRFASSAWALHRHLRRRTQVTDPDVAQRFARLCADMRLRRVQLSVCEGLQSPLVIGACEVCVPRDLLTALPTADGDAVLAHELAHIERRDGVWFPLVGAVQSLFWFQPLNHWVSSCFRDTAELACDDRAVELTTNPLALARALLHVAERSTSVRPLVAPMVTLSPSGLGLRVRRLTSMEVAARRGPRGWVTLAPLLLGAALATLSIRLAKARSEPRHLTRPAATATGGADAADIAAQNAQMLSLAEREAELQRQLLRVRALPESARERTNTAAQELELEQELRHLHETQTWLEQRFVREWSTAEGAPR